MLFGGGGYSWFLGQRTFCILGGCCILGQDVTGIKFLGLEILKITLNAGECCYRQSFLLDFHSMAGQTSGSPNKRKQVATLEKMPTQSSYQGLYVNKGFTLTEPEWPASSPACTKAIHF